MCVAPLPAAAACRLGGGRGGEGDGALGVLGLAGEEEAGRGTGAPGGDEEGWLVVKLNNGYIRL